MKADWHYEPETGALNFSGYVEPEALAKLHLSKVDLALFAKPATKASELFGTLAMLFLRSEQLAEAKAVKS